MKLIPYNYQEFTPHVVQTSYTIKEGDRLFFKKTDLLVTNIDTYLKATYKDVKRVKKVEEANVVYGYAVGPIVVVYKYKDAIYDTTAELYKVIPNPYSYTVHRFCLRNSIEELPALSEANLSFYNHITNNLSKYTLVKNTNSLKLDVDAYMQSLLPKAKDGLGEKLQLLIMNNTFDMILPLLKGKNVSDYKTELVECFYMVGDDMNKKKSIRELFKFDTATYKALNMKSQPGSWWTISDFVYLKRTFPFINLLKIIQGYLPA